MEKVTYPTDTGELAKLRASLAQCQLELAAVREQQEEWAEQLAPLQHAQERFLDLTDRLDAWFTELEREPARGLRARLTRRFTLLPSEEEAEQIARLRATPLFDGAWYLREYPSVIGSGLSPALHYLRRGARNGRNPGPDFDTQRYYRDHPDLPRRQSPLLHYLETQGAASPSGTQ